MEIMEIVVQVLIALLAILIPPGIGTAIALVVIARHQADPLKKKKMNKGALWAAVGPIVLLFLVLSLWGLVRIATNTAGV